MYTLQLRDGRKLGYMRYGAPGGRPVFYFHGLPGSRCEGLLLDEPARALNVQVVAVDRPGYGLSSLQPGRQLRDWPQDVVALANALGFDSFGVLGVSGGGPYVYVCAHAVPQRIAAAGVVCGLAPVTDRTLRQGMRWLARSAFYLAQNRPLLLHVVYGQPLTWLARMHGSLPLRLLAQLNGEPDKSVMLRPDVLSALTQNIKESFRQGPRGAEHDLRVLAVEWGFQLQSIRKSVHIWHGDVDSVVPSIHSEYVHSCLRDAQLCIVSGEAHFSLPVMHRTEVLRTILQAGTW